MKSKKFIAALMIGVSLLTVCGLELHNPEAVYAAQKAKKKAKKTKKSKQKQAKKSAYVHQCRKCGFVWEEHGLSGAMLGMFGAFADKLSQAAYGNNPPNNWDCPMGGYCIWVRIKRR